MSPMLSVLLRRIFEKVCFNETIYAHKNKEELIISHQQEIIGKEKAIKELQELHEKLTQGNSQKEVVRR